MKQRLLRMNELIWKPDYKISRQVLILLGMSLVPVYAAFAYIGRPAQGIAIAAAVGITILAIRIHWRLRGYAWFWAALIFAVLLQTPLILFPIPMNKDYTLGTVFPLMLLDYALIHVCVRTSFRIAARRDKQNSLSTFQA